MPLCVCVSRNIHETDIMCRSSPSVLFEVGALVIWLRHRSPCWPASFQVSSSPPPLRRNIEVKVSCPCPALICELCGSNSGPRIGTASHLVSPRWCRLELKGQFYPPSRPPSVMESLQGRIPCVYAQVCLCCAWVSAGSGGGAQACGGLWTISAVCCVSSAIHFCCSYCVFVWGQRCLLVCWFI